MRDETNVGPSSLEPTMSQLESLTSTLVLHSARALSGYAASGLLESRPELGERLHPAAFPRWQNVFVQFLEELAAAMATRRPQVLVQHVQWLAAGYLLALLSDYMERTGDTLKLKRFEGPTSVENLAQQLFSEISALGFRLERLEVQETDTSTVIYTRRDWLAYNRQLTQRDALSASKVIL
jgi:hypothetical protein